MCCRLLVPRKTTTESKIFVGHGWSVNGLWFEDFHYGGGPVKFNYRLPSQNGCAIPESSHQNPYGGHLVVVKSRQKMVGFVTGETGQVDGWMGKRWDSGVLDANVMICPDFAKKANQLIVLLMRQFLLHVPKNIKTVRITPSSIGGLVKDFAGWKFDEGVFVRS